MAYSDTHTNMTSKLVVGFGLAALCAVGASIFAVQAKRHVANDAAMSAATQPLSVPPTAATTNGAIAGDTSAPPPLADSSVPPANAAVAPTTPDVNPTPAATPASPAVDEPVPAIKAKKKSTRTSDQGMKPRSVDKSSPVIDSTPPVNGATLAGSATGAADASAAAAPPKMELTPSVSSADTAAAAPAQPSISATAPAAPADATAQQQAAPQQPADTASAPTDSQISDSVKSEIASAEPGSKVVVTTSNGAVSLVGSVPNQDAIVQASQAAQRIAGVKSVDSTGLFVSNQ